LDVCSKRRFLYAEFFGLAWSPAPVVLGGIFIIGHVYILCAIVVLFTGKKATGYVLEGFESKKIVHIFSDYNEEIALTIRRNLGAHTSILEGRNDGAGNVEDLQATDEFFTTR